MRLEIKHQITHTYSTPTILHPHVIRCKPFHMSHYSIQDYQLNISPKPKGETSKKDIINNTVLFSWFDAPVTEFKVDLRFIAETKPFDPLDFVVYPEQFLELNFHYSRKRWPLLIPYLEITSMSRDFKLFTKDIADNAKNQTLLFIRNVIEEIHKQFVVHYSMPTQTDSPLEILNQRQGTPYEIAWMTVHMMRANGIAARLVSGYCLSGAEQLSERHVWLQVYVPGPGWLGLDPSNGRITDHNYVPVVAGPYFDSVTSVAGDTKEPTEKKVTELIEIKRL